MGLQLQLYQIAALLMWPCEFKKKFLVDSLLTISLLVRSLDVLLH